MYTEPWPNLYSSINVTFNYQAEYLADQAAFLIWSLITPKQKKAGATKFPFGFKPHSVQM